VTTAAGAGPEPIAVPAPRRRITFGRDAANDLVLDHPAVASRHAEVVAGPEGLMLRDLTTALDHGTRLNGQLVAGAVLVDGDAIGIGPWALRLRDGSFVPEIVDARPLEARGVGLAVDGKWLLQPTDLAFDRGELVAVLGPSGAGKSTLLHALAGLRTPTAGVVLVHGDEVARRQVDLGFVPQEETVHRLLSAREALGFAARLRLSGGRDVWDAAVAHALEEVGLTARADQPIGTMSGGQRKRVALAQELIGRPSVLLLDEPTSGLDPGLDHRMMTLMRSLADGGRTVVVVTHSVAHIDVCDRVVVMALGGKVAYAGPPAEAPAAFGVEVLAEVFDKLEDDEQATAPIPEDLRVETSMSGRVIARRRGVLAQSLVLIRRFSLLTLRDRRNLRLLTIQAVALSVAAGLLFERDVFHFSSGTAHHAGESAQLLFLMVTMALWFGAISAARQIVAERSVLARDMASGVSTEAYLLSKAVVLGIVAAAQTMLMALLIFVLRPLGAAPGEAQIVVALLVLTAWVGVAFGLVVSAFARSEDQATSYIPLVLLPQLLFGGAVVPTAQLSGLMSLVSHLAAAQWAFAGIGHVIHMNHRIAGDPVFSSASRYGESFFDLGTMATAIVLLAFIFGCAIVLQAHLRPSVEDTWWTQIRAWQRTRRITEATPASVETRKAA
jgi:ABC-type multidrug transport system ATPase subunit